MQANPNNLQAIFAMPVHYLIPTFQRQYTWTEEKQWKPLWEDVLDTAERYLREKDTIPVEDMHAHFVGAIVLQLQTNPLSSCILKLVIDGQQRLTTLQLLIDATLKVFEEFDQQSALRECVQNSKSWALDAKNHFYKVWPTATDQAAFLHAMSNEPLNKEDKNSLIVKAHNFFKEQVHQWIKDDPQERARALEATITKLLNIVVIDIDRDDNPNIIFETLNDRGTPLTQAELVKNFILYRAKSEEDKEHADMLHHNYLMKLENSWWKKKMRRGRLFRPRVDTFLNYWITMQRKNEVQTGDVFDSIRKYADDDSIDDNSISEIASPIGNMADIYRDIYQRIEEIEKTRHIKTELDQFLYRWNAMDVGVLTPVLLQIISFELPIEKLERCLHIIESYLVRRIVCGMTPKDYNNLFLSLLQKLEKENADETIKDFLKNQSAVDRIWPSDVHLKNAFLQEPLYNLRPSSRIRVILEGIEEQLREGKTEVSIGEKLTVEHIMPKEWSENWPLVLDSDVLDLGALKDAGAERERLIHTIGNLTLVTGKLNTGLSNAPWAEKRERLRKYSGLLLKDSITSEDVWNEDAIKERSIYLAEVAAKVWPHADRI